MAEIRKTACCYNCACRISKQNSMMKVLDIEAKNRCGVDLPPVNVGIGRVRSLLHSKLTGKYKNLEEWVNKTGEKPAFEEWKKAGGKGFSEIRYNELLDIYMEWRLHGPTMPVVEIDDYCVRYRICP